MHVRKVRIENIRGFGEGVRGLDLDLRRPDGSLAGWTVLAGRNGTGKSTLLQAIAVAIAGPSHAPRLLPDFSRWMRQGRGAGRVTLDLEFSGEDSFSQRGKTPQSPLSVALEWPKPEEGDGEPQVCVPEGFSETSLRRGPWRDGEGWFLAGYGPFRRMTGHSTEATSMMKGRLRLSSLATLFQEDASLAEGVQALKDIYLRKMEGDKVAVELERGMLDLLRDDLLPTGVQVLRVDSAGLWVRDGGMELPLAAISDGYRATAALVLDLLTLMQRSFDKGFRIARDPKGRPFVPHSGVVLIDEADVHLHVSWQQRIGFWLKEHFPQVQFLVTTHSPFICQAADPGGLIRLAPAGSSPPAERVDEILYRRVVSGGADDAVVSALFGLDHSHSPQAERDRARLADLEAQDLSATLSPEEQAELRALHAAVPANASAAVEQALRQLDARLAR